MIELVPLIIAPRITFPKNQRLLQFAMIPKAINPKAIICGQLIVASTIGPLATIEASKAGVTNPASELIC